MAWVIDAHTGRVIYQGPTDLSTQTGHLGVEQLGEYAVAGKMNQGIYGIGDTANTTWFVPGDGHVVHDSGTTDIPPPPFATQDTGSADRMVVFSLVDGKVVQPQLDANVRPFRAVVYPGGFAVEVTSDKVAATPDAVLFFDTDGKLLGKDEASGFLETSSQVLPITSSRSKAVVYSPQGYPLADITGFNEGLSVLLGTRLFVNLSHSNAKDEWHPYDLDTGAKGPMCQADMYYFVGSDGTTAVFTSDRPALGETTHGVDIATCTDRWSFTTKPGAYRKVWRINTTLVQLSDDGTELMSLVAPN